MKIQKITGLIVLLLFASSVLTSCFVGGDNGNRSNDSNNSNGNANAPLDGALNGVWVDPVSYRHPSLSHGFAFTFQGEHFTLEWESTTYDHSGIGIVGESWHFIAGSSPRSEFGWLGDIQPPVTDAIIIGAYQPTAVNRHHAVGFPAVRVAYSLSGTFSKNESGNLEFFTYDNYLAGTSNFQHTPNELTIGSLRFVRQ